MLDGGHGSCDSAEIVGRNSPDYGQQEWADIGLPTAKRYPEQIRISSVNVFCFGTGWYGSGLYGAYCLGCAERSTSLFLMHDIINYMVYVSQSHDLRAVFCQHAIQLILIQVCSVRGGD